jgi:hypothetical protein
VSGFASFPDAERAVLAAVADLGITGVETPATLADSLPFIRVQRTGGGDDRITDTADAEVSVFATGLTQAKAVAETIRQRLLAGGIGTSHGVIDSARTTAGPVAVPPTDSANLRQVTTSYQVTMRRSA